MIHGGISQRITTGEAMRIFEECKAAGLAQTGDNVQRSVTFICNCCGCCCTLIQAVRTYQIRNGIVSSNWIQEVDPARCKGCGACAKACPMNAIAMVVDSGGERKGELAGLDESLCLGCGVCCAVCKVGAIRMKARARRVFTPETTFEKTVRMAIERGKLADLVFETPERLSHRALGRILSILEKSPPGKAAMAIKPLRSAFLNAMLRRLKRHEAKV
jgi:formate hydrogenlyase subunit 6/NADH:ubiquinone oxidoreductase subunit I